MLNAERNAFKRSWLPGWVPSAAWPDVFGTNESKDLLRTIGQTKMKTSTQCYKENPQQLANKKICVSSFFGDSTVLPL